MKTSEQEFFEQIDKIKKSNTTIIVEGKKDKIALQNFGINDIITLNKKPLFEVVENISSRNRECIILTDLDKTGKQLYGKLNHGLQQFGVKIDDSFRNFLYKKTKLDQIEGLATYIEKIQNQG